MKKVPYREGTWFAVPLLDTGYLVGLVARKAPKGKVLLGYFFGPRRSTVPDISEVSSYRPANAIMIRRFSDQSLVKGEWPILGVQDSWDNNRWPMPDFGRHIDPIAGYPPRAWRVRHPDDNPNALLYETPITIDEYKRLPDNGMSLHGAVEIMLTKLLGGTAAREQKSTQPSNTGPTVDFYLYFPSEMAAVRSLEKLQAKGYKAEVHESDSNWLTLATFYGRLTEKELNDIESQLEGVAESEGGEYDGHERDV